MSYFLKYYPVYFIFLFTQNYAQQYREVEKEIEVYDVEIKKIRDQAVYLDLFPVRYIGEQASETNFGFGFGLQKFFSPMFNLKYGIKYGTVSFNDSMNNIKNTSFFGVEAHFNFYLIEAIQKKKEFNKFSPYLSFGLGAYASNAEHYNGQGQLDLAIPLAVGVDYQINENFMAGLNIGMGMLLSDQYDNVSTSAGGDITLTPGINFKYIFKNRTIENRIKRMKTIVVKEEIPEPKDYPIYKAQSEDISTEPFVEVKVKDMAEVNSDNTNNTNPEGGKIGNWTYPDDNKKTEENNKSTDKIGNWTEPDKKSTSDNNTWTREDNTNEKYPVLGENHKHVFFTIQIGSYQEINYSIERKKGIEPDFVVNNKAVGYYNHMVGFYASRQEAINALAEIKENEPRAYVTAIAFGKRVKIGEAERLIRKDPSLLNIQESVNQIGR